MIYYVLYILTDKTILFRFKLLRLLSFARF